jgi:uncharacterized delta-60 repeat protein
LAVLAALVPVRPAGAVGAGFDPTFGRDGIFRLDLTEPSLDVANAAGGQYGQPVLAGSAGGRFAVTVTDRWTPILVDFGRPSAAYALASSGERTVAAGGAGDDFALACFGAADGNPMVDFGDNGRVRTSFGAPAVAYGVTAPGFVPLAVGTVQAGAGSSVAMARYLANGSLDPSFGTGGRVIADITPGNDSANAVASTNVYPLGTRITVAGQAGPDVLLARYLTDGTPDPAFGTGGRVVFSVTPGNDVAYALQVGSWGEILVSGSADGQAFVGSFSPAGAPVSGFGSGGVVRSALGGTAARFRTVAGDSDKITASGTVSGPFGDDAVVARFGPDGTPDATFGAGGRTVVDFGGRLDESNAVRGDGTNLMLVGGDGADMVMASVKSSDGSVVTSSGSAVLTKVDFGAPTYDLGGAVAVLPDGRSLIAGTGTRGLFFVRLMADGAPDPSFGTGGTVVTSLVAGVAGMAVVGNRILILFQSRYGHWSVIAFTASGALDHSYGSYGYASMEGSALDTYGLAVMAAMPDGRVVIGSGSSVVRLSATGQVETSFRTSQAGSREMVGLVVQPDGKIVTLHRGITMVGATLTRFLPDGTLDPSFSNSGWLVGVPVVADPSALLLLADGRFVVGAKVTTVLMGPPETPDLVVARFSADGRLDGTFGVMGATRTPVSDLERVVTLHERSDGAVVAAFTQRAAFTGLGVARYLADGRTDTSFGVGGVRQFDGVHAYSTAQTAAGAILVAGTAGEDLVVARALVADGASGGTPAPPSPPPPAHPAAFGLNIFGELGDGTTVARPSPVDTVLTDVVEVSAGAYHVLSRRADGTVWASGWNAFGQLGDGSTTTRATPVKVQGLSNVVSISAGVFHSLAVTADGSVWAWGWNVLGQLGDGTTTDRSTPVKVAGLGGVATVSGGVLHSAAVGQNGSLTTWGWNGVGQLGLGTTIDQLRPTVVSGIGGVSSVAVGWYHTVALKTDGTVWAWGWNPVGQLGDATSVDRHSPVRVTGLTNVVAVAAGVYHGLARHGDGTVSAWGWNGFGQLGDGTVLSRLVPVKVPGLLGVTSLSAGTFHSVARLTDGTLMSWGWNGGGQLGDGTLKDRASPGRVPSLYGVASVAAGTVDTVVIRGG